VADSTSAALAPVGIVIADDHAVLRRGLRGLLEEEPGFTVVAEAGDVEAALREAVAHRPQVVILDLNMPGTPTLDAIPRFRSAVPTASVVVLTMQAEPVLARRALVGGASGYVLKDAAEGELVAAVRAAAAGRTYVTPELGARLATLPVDAALEPGTTFANHRLEAIAGRGGMGVVFRATDLALDRTVALKVISPAVAADPVFRERFEREARAAAAIDHPHVVQVFHAGEEHGLLYLTMRFVAGTDLRTEIRDGGALQPSRAVSVVAQVADALDAAHARGLVHRDVKPANVLIDRRPEREHAFLTDFGVTVGPLDEHLTRTGSAVGTTDYVSPEQAAGRETDARSDVYSLGCVLFEALTGVVLYDRDTDLGKLWAHVHDPPPALLDLRPELPPVLGAALARALAKDPRDRQQSAGELGRDVLAAVSAR
jgi:DNA-binding NarL/FixJ family response regulator